jgi:hypothetical protein
VFAWVVDRLPVRLWRIGNLYMLPGGDWHVCHAPNRDGSASVRTIEWRGHVLTRGRKPFDYEATGYENGDV